MFDGSGKIMDVSLWHHSRQLIEKRDEWLRGLGFFSESRVFEIKIYQS
jgi:hypothetical protein